MSQLLGTELPDRALSYLQVGRLVIMATVDGRGRPNTAPMSWVTALDNRTIRVAVSPEVSTYHNILENDRVMLSLIGGPMILSISGRARVLAVSIGQRGRQATPRGRGAAKRAGEHTKRVQGDTLRGLIVRGARWFLPANRGLSLVGTYRDQLADTR